MIKHLLYLCTCVTLIATPLAAQTVELSTRTFWLGERPPTMDDDRPFFSPNRIAWIEAILDADPTLNRAVFHIEESYLSVRGAVSEPYDGEILLGPDRLPPQFDLPDYQIYGPPVSTARTFEYFPADPGTGFKVWCSQGNDNERFDLCVVYATYAPDDRIKLKARLYFPPDPVDRPDYFRDVAKRMREVTYCLDVTDRLHADGTSPEAAVTANMPPPTLTGCEPDLPS